MTYYVYIIRSKEDRTFYTGITNNLFRRLAEHNGAKNSTKTTYLKGKYVLIHAEELEGRKRARIREKFWKSGYGRELREKILKMGW